MSFKTRDQRNAMIIRNRTNSAQPYASISDVNGWASQFLTRSSMASTRRQRTGIVERVENGEVLVTHQQLRASRDALGIQDQLHVAEL